MSVKMTRSLDIGKYTILIFPVIENARYVLFFPVS